MSASSSVWSGSSTGSAVDAFAQVRVVFDLDRQVAAYRFDEHAVFDRDVRVNAVTVQVAMRAHPFELVLGGKLDFVVAAGVDVRQPSPSTSHLNALMSLADLPTRNTRYRCGPDEELGERGLLVVLVELPEVVLKLRSASRSSGSSWNVPERVNREHVGQSGFGLEADLDVVAEQNRSPIATMSRGTQLFVVVIRSVASSFVSIEPNTSRRASLSRSSRDTVQRHGLEPLANDFVRAAVELVVGRPRAVSSMPRSHRLVDSVLAFATSAVAFAASEWRTIIDLEKHSFLVWCSCALPMTVQHHQPQSKAGALKHGYAEGRRKCEVLRIESAIITARRATRNCSSQREWLTLRIFYAWRVRHQARYLRQTKNG